MSESMDEAFERFKETWDPKSELVKQMKLDRERDELMRDKSVQSLHVIVEGISKQVNELYVLKDYLDKIQKTIYTDMKTIAYETQHLIEHNDKMMKWWESQNELINKQMLMMASMGFELNLGE